MNAYAVETDGLTVRYGDYTALDRVTIQIPEGAFVSIVGPNGAGKTTFLKNLLGLALPVKGNTRLFGKDPSTIPPQWIGYAPQVKTLDRTFPARVLELVVSGERFRWPWRVSPGERERALNALESAGVRDLAARQVGCLSEGQLQRVYLARCLVRQPRLVLLDEPAAWVDVTGEANLFNMLQRYQQETQAAIIMVTHDWNNALTYSTHVLLLNRRVVGIGPPKEVFADELLYATFGSMCPIHSIHRGEGSDA